MNERWQIGWQRSEARFCRTSDDHQFGATARIRWAFRQYCRVLTHVIALRRVARRASELVRGTA